MWKGGCESVGEACRWREDLMYGEKSYTERIIHSVGYIFYIESPMSSLRSGTCNCITVHAFCRFEYFHT